MRFSAVLLAGGKSKRMGRDKALLEIHGQPLWQRQLETLRALQPEQLFLSGPSREGMQSIEDEVEGGGPLAGVASAFHHCTTPLLLVLAVDLPRMKTAYLQALLSDCQEGKGVVPRSSQFFEPLAAVYPVAAASLADEHLRRGDLSMQTFVRAALRAELLVERRVAEEEHELFTNLNTPADL